MRRPHNIFHQRVFDRRRFIGWLLAATFLHVVSPTAFSQVPPAAPITTQTNDNRRLEVIEELSESLANDILELSVATRDRDIELMAEYFPASFVGKPFPTRPKETVAQVKWVGVHQWEQAPTVKTSSTGTAPETITSKAFLQTWSEFLDHFSEIEDVRFKVKEANFDERAQAVLGADEPTAVVGAKGGLASRSM